MNSLDYIIIDAIKHTANIVVKFLSFNICGIYLNIIIILGAIAYLTPYILNTNINLSSKMQKLGQTKLPLILVLTSLILFSISLIL